MKAADVLRSIRDTIEALEPFDQATPQDRFHGAISMDPAATLDRTFSVGSSLPTRNTDYIDASEYVMTVAIAIAYMDGEAAHDRILNDAEQVVEALFEMGSELGFTIEPIPEGVIHPGPAAGTLIASRMFRLRYTMG